MKDFLQSKEWREFQKSFGRKTFFVSGDGVEASLIEHVLPIVGKYLYIPRGINFQLPISNYQSIPNDKILEFLNKIIDLARKEKAGWIRLDIDSEDDLSLLTGNTNFKIKKAPHDVQPKETFVISIEFSEEEILSEMKPKTRYNIKLAQKKGVAIKEGKEYLNDFLRLTKIMAKRQGIIPHPDEYYQKMLENISPDVIKLFVAEYQGEIIAADLIVFYDKVATYLHGASDENHRNVMAPHLLKWQEIQEAKKRNCTRFDFGGVKTEDDDWKGITRFKLGFSKKTKPTKFLGSYDIILNPAKYFMYRFLQRLKNF